MSAAVPGAVASQHYFDRDFGRMAVKLLPSEYYVSAKNAVMTTVLGSCVAACLLDLEAGVAGMNHFMLAEEGESSSRDQVASMRYGAHAMDVLIREMTRVGARRDRLQAKVFGGAAVLTTMSTLNIGDCNADFVLRYLRAKRIGIAAQDLRGQHARRIGFFPETGKVLVRKLRQQVEVQRVQREESDLLRTLSSRNPGAVHGTVIGGADAARAIPAAEKTKGGE